MKRCHLYVLLSLSLRLPLAAQEKSGDQPVASAPVELTASPPVSPVEAALTKTQEAFVESFNKTDAVAVAGFYDEAATYTSDSGKYMEGRTAIEAGMKEYFKVNPGARLTLQTTGVREVTPDVAIHSGLAVFSGTAGAEEVTRFKAVYAKRGDAWKIVELSENVLPAAERGQLELKALDWLTGDWQDQAEGDSVTTRAAWTKSGHFLRRSISVATGGEESMQATEIIGWDPLKAVIRSWVFDSEGGFGEGVWTQEGNRWVVKTTSTLPNGQRASSLNIFTIRDAGTYTWESTNREVDGEVLASIEKVTVVRATPPAEAPVTPAAPRTPAEQSQPR
jgi:uncharacterized protein (TIGR02246 family)